MVMTAPSCVFVATFLMRIIVWPVIFPAYCQCVPVYDLNVCVCGYKSLKTCVQSSYKLASERKLAHKVLFTHRPKESRRHTGPKDVCVCVCFICGGC